MRHLYLSINPMLFALFLRFWKSYPLHILRDCNIFKLFHVKKCQFLIRREYPGFQRDRTGIAKKYFSGI